MTVPPDEWLDRQIARNSDRRFLVYTRRTGWRIVRHDEQYGLRTSPGGGIISTGEVLARAELPPVPEGAA